MSDAASFLCGARNDAGVPMSVTSARRLCAELAAAGVTISATSSTTLVAAPRRAMTDELAALIRRFKPELLSVLQRITRARLAPSIAACAGCDAEFVHASEQLCAWCASADVTAECAPRCALPMQRRFESAPRTTVLSVRSAAESRTVRDSWGHSL